MLCGRGTSVRGGETASDGVGAGGMTSYRRTACAINLRVAFKNGGVTMAGGGNRKCVMTEILWAWNR